MKNYNISIKSSKTSELDFDEKSSLMGYVEEIDRNTLITQSNRNPETSLNNFMSKNQAKKNRNTTQLDKNKYSDIDNKLKMT